MICIGFGMCYIYYYFYYNKFFLARDQSELLFIGHSIFRLRGFTLVSHTCYANSHLYFCLRFTHLFTVIQK